MTALHYYDGSWRHEQYFSCRIISLNAKLTGAPNEILDTLNKPNTGPQLFVLTDKENLSYFKTCYLNSYYHLKVALCHEKFWVLKLLICHCYVYLATSSVGILLPAGKFWDEDKDEMKIRWVISRRISLKCSNIPTINHSIINSFARQSVSLLNIQRI